ncbi:glycosyl transferase family 2 [bacterium M21]|nr:glycosyl transferase family 2 [bacterium M21]
MNEEKGNAPRCIDVSIIVPCLNEEDNIQHLLTNLTDLLGAQEFTCEIVIVDDQSDDGTLSRVQDFTSGYNGQVEIIVEKKNLDRRGYGAVIRYGMAVARGRYCTFVSADMVDPIELIPEFYKAMSDGYDLAQCNRYSDEAHNELIPFIYKFYQFFFRRFIHVACGEFIVDSSYAFKMFERKMVLAMGLTQNRFSVSPEITMKLVLNNAKIKYIPGRHGERENGVSKFRFTKEAAGYLYVVLRTFLHRRRLTYWY